MRNAGRLGFILALVAAFPGLAGLAMAEPRVALVIGNSNYGGELGVLANPANDAQLMAKTLKGIGFTVVEAEDADQAAMKRAISDFGEQLANAGTGATGLFFYAGHGLQVGGENYLIPIHANIRREPDVDIEAVPATLVLRQMDFAGSAVNIVILDACRNNPLTRGFRSVTRGLAEIGAKPRGSFIAYSTAPGDVAEDGNGANSPYTTALAESIVVPGRSINDVFQAVRGKVLAATNKKQVPWDSSSLTAPYFFVSPPEEKLVVTPPPPPTGVDPKTIELTFWDAIKDSSSVEDYEAYLVKYPEGDFAPLAKNRIKKLQGVTAETPPQPPAPPEVVVAAAEPPPTIPAASAEPPLPSAADPVTSAEPPATEPAPQTASVAPTAPTMVDAADKLFAKDKARLRSAPDAGANIVAQLDANTPLQATGRSVDGKWWRVTLADGRSGYVSAGVVSDQPPQKTAEASPTPVGDDADTCKIDSGAAPTDRIAACRRLLDSVTLDDPARSSILVKLGVAHFDAGDLETALRQYRAALELTPDNAAAYYDIGLVHINRGRYSEARAAFDKAAMLDPKDPDAIFRRGQSTSYLGDFDAGIRDAERAVAMKGPDYVYIDTLSSLRLAKGDVPSAVADVDRALAADADYWGAGSILTLYLGGADDRSLAMADRAIGNDPGYPYWWLWKALNQMAAGDAADAAATLAAGRAAFGRDAWPAPLFDFFDGKISEAKLWNLAKANDAKTQSQRICEVNYYIGELAYLAGDTAAARAAFLKSVNSRIYEYVEFSAAKARLAILDQ